LLESHERSWRHDEGTVKATGVEQELVLIEQAFVEDEIAVEDRPHWRQLTETTTCLLLGLLARREPQSCTPSRCRQGVTVRLGVSRQRVDEVVLAAVAAVAAEEQCLRLLAQPGADDLVGVARRGGRRVGDLAAARLVAIR
jgi:hypothetical protein